MIIAHDLYRIYTMGQVKVNALNGVSVEIKKGEFVGVTGPSGSGKSTLLHLLGLLDRPTSGEIRIDGIDTRTLSEDQRSDFRLTRLGYVFQEYALVPELTVFENVILPFMAREDSPEQSRDQVMEVLASRFHLVFHHLSLELDQVHILNHRVNQIHYFLVYNHHS